MLTVKKPRVTQVLFVCLTLVALAPLAQATILNPGDFNVAPDVFGPVVGGTIVASISPPVTVSASSFTARYSVFVQADPNNVLCPNCLDFIYRFFNDGPDLNGRYSMGSFSGFKTDVGFITGSGEVPNTVDRTAAPGSVIGFNYLGSNQVDPGDSTDGLIIETNATHFAPGLLSLQDMSAVSAASFEPATAIPEPSSLALFGGAVMVFAQVLRRKRL